MLCTFNPSSMSTEEITAALPKAARSFCAARTTAGAGSFCSSSEGSTPICVMVTAIERPLYETVRPPPRRASNVTARRRRHDARKLRAHSYL